MEMQTNLLFLHALKYDSHCETKLYRCSKFNSIQFIHDSSLYGRKITLYTNYNNDYHSFERNRYTELPFLNHKAFIRFENSGSFYFFYNEYDSNIIIGSFYIVVSPQLKVGDQLNSLLPIDSIQCHTVLSKCLGSFDSWRSKLEVSQKSGYNMIHFTPIQELGASNSAYSLKDQLKLNPLFNTDKTNYTIEDVGVFTDKLRREWKMLSITDIVLNHTANESPWLQTNPESAYNCSNSPWLRPAYMLDRLLWLLTTDIIDDRWNKMGINVEINTEKHLQTLKKIFNDHYLLLVNIHELYMIDINKSVKEFKELLENYCEKSIPIKSNDNFEEIKIIQDKYKRLGSKIDMNNALNLVINRVDFNGNKEEWIEWSCEHLRFQLSNMNDNIKNEINYHLSCAIDNVLSAVRYERIDSNGPKIKAVSRKQPLVPQYFTHKGDVLDLLNLMSEEQIVYDDNSSQFLMAHNGWVMNDDPLRNFAEEGCNVYIRRELIAWSDCVKLKYGSTPKDNPFLWDYMEKYVTQMARVFNGLRLDNCHSTPINVAQYMIDAARRVNPDFYLIAELFTSSEQLDNIFVNKLGINSLIRESLSAGNAHDLGRQVYRYGGDPVGSFPPETIKTENSHYLIRPLQQSICHAIFFDVTHDNESPIIKRSAYDLLPSSAIVAMTCCATGSNRGYDELVPHHINVVRETRVYNIWSKKSTSGVSDKTGIIRAKRALNSLHKFLGSNGFDQLYVDQRDADTIAVTRHNPETHESVVLVARTAFSPPSLPLTTGHIAPLFIEGKIETILLESQMVGEVDKQFDRSDKVINGYLSLNANIRSDLSIDDSAMVRIISTNITNEIHFFKFPPSSVIAFKVSLSPIHATAVKQIKNIIKECDDIHSEIASIVHAMSLIDINFILFQCDHEERDNISGGAYNVPSFGSLNYCGIAGIMSHLTRIRTSNDLGHPLCGNLRDGDWLPNYIVKRLSKRAQTVKLSQWLSLAFKSLSELPRYLIPRYFDAIITPLYLLILDRIWSHSNLFIQDGSHFVQLLALGSVALIGANKTSPLPPLSPKISNESILQSTIAAGLPHFASGYMRNWGRDTFISIKGLLILTGRFVEAKHIIVGFAGALRHGLIPNLLDGGINARYNCRDAVWWWLQAIKDYCLLAPKGIEILCAPVRRLYPNDDSPALVSNDDLVEEPLYKTIQEALQRHFNGIKFVERNAGTSIDEHMCQNGFNINIGVSDETGFIFGGNVDNCGTWMDKMGSSHKAHNKGRPSTPRDGSAVEIIGLSKSVINWLSDMYDKQHYNYDGVVRSDGTKISFKEWANLIQLNFEKYFFVSHDLVDPLVNRRAIYKDTYGATIKWQDFQLRPNFLIAMVVAPELFEFKRAENALDIVSNTLIGPLGVKTLDPSDLNYRPDYDNSNDSDDYHTAHGFNYHNGPEWLWLMGYYLQAIMKFTDNEKQTIIKVKQILSKHYQNIQNSDWFGLPELTNSDGKHCHHSCPIQAWSHSTLLEVLHICQLYDNAFK